MNLEIAKKIGSRLAIRSILIGLFIAQCIMTIFASDNGILKGFFWFTDFDYLFNIIFEVIVSLTTAYYFGRIAGKRILINGNNEILVGILTGLIIIIVSSFVSSWVGFFQEGIDNIGTNDDPFYDYIFKPIYAVTFFGFIPVLIVGSVYGTQIKKHKIKENPADNK
ncbi:MAG: hypothetical protein ACJATI_004145 [Halioglobus sp.]|jgi:hypothetical protein